MTNDLILEDYRPDWLFGLEIDLFIPSVGLAFEFNGDQHYWQTSFGSPDFQKKRDKNKKRIILSRGLKFIIVEAIDLEGHAIRRLIRKALGRELSDKLTKFNKLNIECQKYRKLLLEKYGSPTCKKRSTKARAKSVKAFKSKYVDAATPTPSGEELRKENSKAMVVVTEKMLLDARSDAGAWSRAQLALIGVSWPLSKGWKTGVIGTTVTEKAANLFLSTRKTKKP